MKRDTGKKWRARNAALNGSGGYAFANATTGYCVRNSPLFSLY
ncbi:hypothetical protein BN1221_02981c [Brenneria goodwinii]|uniref:Uncharacterized protein n=1 Tax=Brenneria goodwinii TaxID=1109412 RepID=A0A0G4JX28_9GAMM|nr:hypothetical protein BN1221_02981c [Brenneria goodwinii]